MSPSDDPVEDLQINFDYNGRAQHAQQKWARVRAIAGVPLYMFGTDHERRSITMRLNQVWSFDQVAAAYVLH